MVPNLWYGFLFQRSYYDEEQIDDEAISLMQNPVNYEDTQEDADVETQEVTIKANTILLVEDNGNYYT